MWLTTWIVLSAWGSGAELGAEQACEEGVAEACRLTAEAYVSGDGVPVDFARAIARFGDACELGSAESCVVLAERYRDGLDVEADPARSAEWYAAGCEGGLGDACRLVGDLHRQKAFAEASPEHAMGYYRSGCNQRDAQSCMAVVEGLEQSGARFTDTRAHLEAACTFGALEGCTTLSEQLSPYQAMPWYERGCELGHVPSCREHGIALAKGAGVARDREAGRTELTFACEANDGPACAVLGDLLRRTAPADALAAASRACGLGIDKACRRAWRLRRKVEP